VPLAKLAAKVMVGRRLRDLGFTREVPISHVAVKMPVFPFNRFPKVDPVLGPEMKSTGEVMGMDDGFGLAYAKAHMAAGRALPTAGTAFVSVCDADKKYLPPVVRALKDLGFRVVATAGTRLSLEAAGIEGVEHVMKLSEGSPNVRELMGARTIDLIINTPKGHGPHRDDAYIRARALELDIPCITTMSGARAAVDGIRALRSHDWGVLPLQEYFPRKS
jgi:carbamoyl-phosphate synthase large subunit